VEIRPVEPRDLSRLVEIYNHYIATTHFTFDTEPYTVATRTPWLAQFDGKRHRCYVLVEDDRVEGYASSAALKPKAAYGTSVEVSVYLAPGFTGRGRGASLYERLFASLADEDVHRAYALIALPNEPSLKLHRGFGFAPAAHLHEVGRKFGRYWDVVYLEKAL
jgi:phosphinothricin acetyltransferase